MTQVISRYDALRRALEGTVITPDDPGYDEAREVWNGAFDRRPAVVAYCTSAQDVARAVSFARDASLEISVRSGGAHSASGMGVGDAGIAIDLGRVSQVDELVRSTILGWVVDRCSRMRCGVGSSRCCRRSTAKDGRFVITGR
jgi:FAD/FMN-containing dehydrogenase